MICSIAILHLALYWLSFQKYAIANTGTLLSLNVMKQQMNILLQRTSDIENKFAICTNITRSEKPLPQPRIRIFRGCDALYDDGYTESGVYEIHVFLGFYSMPIFCDMESVGAFSGKRGWMTIQRRINGVVNFDRGWNDYLLGFGFPDKEHWIGLRNLHKITKQKRVGEYNKRNLILRIDIQDWDGNVGFMEHDAFSILSEEFDFEIAELGRYRGTSGLGSHLAFSANSPFSTYDHNKDRKRDAACVRSQKGGWWFGYCNNMNLNGVYSVKNEKMTRGKIFIRNWKALNPKSSALRYISIKLQ